MTGNEYEEFAVAEGRGEVEEAVETPVEAAPVSTDGAWPSHGAVPAGPVEGAAEPEDAASAELEQTQLHTDGFADAGEDEAVSVEDATALPYDELPEDELPEGEAAAEGDDPFAAWPQAESGAVIEDTPEAGASVEHVEGEIDVPDGYTVFEGMPLGRRRSVAVVVSRFNGGLTNRMLACALDALEDAEVSPDAVTVVPVPGAFELPLAAMALAKTRRYACVIALGVIVRGETPHFDYIAAEAASGLQLAAIETGVPVAFGVLTVETVEQGEARIDRAAEAVRSALEMADLFARLRASAH